MGEKLENISSWVKMFHLKCREVHLSFNRKVKLYTRVGKVSVPESLGYHTISGESGEFSYFLR